MSPVRISRPALIGTHVSGMLTALVLIGCGVAALSLGDPDLQTPGGIMLLAGLLVPVATCLLVLAVLIHRMWKSLQFAGARPTPGKAVGLCFVPCFNLYWIFPAISGWAGEYNRIVRERRLDLPQMSLGLAVTVPVLLVLCLVPYCQVVPMLALALVLIPIFVSQVCGRVNALADAVERGLPEVPEAKEAPPVSPEPPALAEEQADIPTAAPAPPAPAEPEVEPAASVETRLSLLAVVSLIVSTLGFCTGGLGGLIGVILGFVAWRRIGRAENRLHGAGLAVAGTIVGFIGLVLGLVGLVLFLAALFAQR